jgi:D-amino-acid dehydrogenase
MNVVVVGGGLTGMFVSYYLLKDGHSVQVVDTNPNGKTSIYNSGILAPSFAVLPPIGMRSILLRYLGVRGPVYVSPGEALKNPDWFRIGLRKGMHGFEDVVFELSSRSVELYKEFFRSEVVEVDLVPDVIGLYKDSEYAAKRAKSVNCKLLDESEVTKLGIKGISSGILFDKDLSINPAKLFSELRRRLKEMGATFSFVKTSEVETADHKVSAVRTDTGKISGDSYVLASGAWSNMLCRNMNYDPHILPARGLVMLYKTQNLRILKATVFFEDYGITMCQHNENTLRLTSFFELVGFKEKFSDSRKQWIHDTVIQHIIEREKVSPAGTEEGTGFRPCAPDQLPVVGKIPGYDNAYIATGNCRLGVTLAPVTGQIIRSMVAGKDSSEAIMQQISPSRFA